MIYKFVKTFVFILMSSQVFGEAKLPIHEYARNADLSGVIEEIKKYEDSIWGADYIVDAKGPGGYTPLMYVVSQITSSSDDPDRTLRLFEIAQLLLSKGANPLYTNNSGMSPFFFACKDVISPMVEIMLKRGINPLYVIKDSGGEPHLNAWTPLHYVASHAHFWEESQWRENTHIVKSLVAANPKILWVRDVQGRTALEIAIEAKNTPVVEFLQKAMKEKMSDFFVSQNRYTLSSRIPFASFGSMTFGEFFKKQGKETNY